MSPQIKQRQIYNGISSDIFAVGVLLFNLISGKMPFKVAS